MGYIQEAEILLDEELCGRIVKEDDRIAQATIRFRENIRLANSIACKYKGVKTTSFDTDDIIQIAYLGLWHACLNFDESRGLAFSTFAVPSIQGMIIRYLRDNEYSIKTPRWFKDIKSYLRHHSEYEIPLSDESIKDIISKAGFKEEHLKGYNNFYIASLEDHVGSDGDFTLEDMMQSIYDIGRELDEDEIENLVDYILKYVEFQNQKCYDIVEEWLYSEICGTPVTQCTLQDKYNLTQSHISKILKKAIRVSLEHKNEILEAAGF